MTAAAPGPANFDRVACAYVWLEYLALGPLLTRTRTHFAGRLADCRRALVLGDGDGRFLAHLLACNPHLEADAVDSSAVMLTLLSRRAATPRLRTYRADARSFTPPRPADLIVTHFFLDCLTQIEADALAERLAANLLPGGLWLVSDFRIPPGRLRVPAWCYVRLLYLAFRLITGLRTTRLPDHARALHAAGLVRIAHHYRLGGMLVSELWQQPRQNRTT